MKAACGAKTRTGGKCRRAPAKSKARCRLHGGAAGSGAPFGPMNGSWRHGRHSRDARDQRKLRHAEGVQRLRAAELKARNRSGGLHPSRVVEMTEQRNATLAEIEEIARQADGER
jgi:hypothetical protein